MLQTVTSDPCPKVKEYTLNLKHMRVKLYTETAIVGHAYQAWLSLKFTHIQCRYTVKPV